MAIEITRVHFEGFSKTHESITRYEYTDLSTGYTGRTVDKPTLVSWIDNKQETAFVGSGYNRVNVGTVHPNDGRRPFVRTYADGNWTNNLLSLPTF
ncbi:DUF3892 domain-containing protein [Cryocola sp. 340MFSha3.1]|uniref:DUF3892 domain-containing protein n=1 Tax=Cryocola sp. 340MFSha3.1 TaxID=1169145 RepID=UPI00036B12BC|nr:DUF3892 domain-containing protein [Cryocola sp. 340MFSha3.1]